MPSSKGKPITILMADDDEDDRMLTQDALEESRVRNTLYCVEDGVELLEYLRREGQVCRPGNIAKAWVDFA